MKKIKVTTYYIDPKEINKTFVVYSNTQKQTLSILNPILPTTKFKLIKGFFCDKHETICIKNTKFTRPYFKELVEFNPIRFYKPKEYEP